MTLKTASIRMDDSKLKRLDAMAKVMNRSRTWLINQAVDKYLNYEEWFIKEVQDGLKEAQNPENLIDHDAVVRKWEVRLEAEMDVTG